MVKRIVALILSLIMVLCIMTACDDVEYVNYRDTNIYFGTSMFSLIEDDSGWMIVYHKETKVMYEVSKETKSFVLLVDREGSPMIYKGE